jgi:hypothetical protein
MKTVFYALLSCAAIVVWAVMFAQAGSIWIGLLAAGAFLIAFPHLVLAVLEIVGAPKQGAADDFGDRENDKKMRDLNALSG